MSCRFPCNHAWLTGVLIAAACFVASAEQAAGQCENGVLEPFGGGSSSFGRSVALNGDAAICGANYNDGQGNWVGAAYVFRFDGVVWSEEARLLASDGVDGDYFGAAVAIDGDVAVIGAHGCFDTVPDAGAAYVFRFNGDTWVEEAKLLAVDPSEDARFGCSAAIHGNVAVIGAYRACLGPMSPGAAYVFRHNGSSWAPETKLIASDPEDNDFFGCSVALHSETAIVGARCSDDFGSSSGSAYIFHPATKPGGDTAGSWEEKAKLLPDDGFPHADFGTSVSIYEDAAVVGVVQDHDHGDGAGAAYVYRLGLTSWEFEKKLLPPEGVEREHMGHSVAVHGDVVVAGAPGIQDGSGGAYLFRQDGVDWIRESMLIPSQPTSFLSAGDEIAMSDENVMVGAEMNQKVFVFAIEGADCNENLLCDSFDIAQSTSSDCNANGVPDECDVYDDASPDCNWNAVPDECDIADGTSEDCNENGIPDECDIEPLVESASAELSPIGFGHPQMYVMEDPPSAIDSLVLSFEASADLDHFIEWIDVDLDGVFLGDVFRHDTGACSDPPDRASLSAGPEVFNEAIATDGRAVITMTGASAVEVDECGGESYISVEIEYHTTSANDCNANGVPDECEGFCTADIHGDCTVDILDLLLVLGAWGLSDVPEDINGDGVVDVLDLVKLLGEWGPC